MTTTARIGVLALWLAACGGAKPAGNEPLDTSREQQPHAMSGRASPTGQPAEPAGDEADEAKTDAEHGKAGEAKADAEHAEHGKAGEAHEMAQMPAPVAKFHDALAPRWHADKGAKRMADTCAAVGELRSDAAAIVAAPAPAGSAPATWKSGGSELAAAVDALGATCKAKDAAAFEPAFARVHTSFHRVMEAGMAHE